MDNTSLKKPTIVEWFRKKNVLITGGTGFMGKVLVSKLLKSCPEIGTIYLIIREKKGIAPKNRITTLLQQEPFRLLRENHPERLKKIVVVSGDTTCDGLGISAKDAETLKNNVSVLINMAANVRFDVPLKTAVIMNTKGTANIIAFAKQIKKLESFVHVSTAYCHCHENELYEKHYPMNVTPETIIRIIDEMPDDIINAITPNILDKQPNTYAFTKALSEDLVNRCGLPSGIARPSIVVGSLKEPDYGWVDNINGPTGLMIGAGKGVLRSMLGNSKSKVDIVPCDIAVNMTIALAWKVGVEQPKNTVFVNNTLSDDNPITWKTAIDTGKKCVIANPFSGPLWYPGGGFTTSKIFHKLVVIFLQMIPAYLLDGLIILTGNKPFLVKVQDRIDYGTKLVQYYTTKEWIFKNEKMKELRNSMSPEDQKIFFTDLENIVWEDYINNYILGTRKYFLKEDPSTLPQARRVFAYLYVMDQIVKIGFMLLMGWLIYSWILPYKATIGTSLHATFIH